jgi:hypothetical protein
MLAVTIDQGRHREFATTSIRPPTRGKSSLARSITRGACGMRPLNQGFTVWRSDDATSIGCDAISERMWASSVLHHIFGVGAVAGDPPRQRVGIAEMGQH